MKKKKTETWHKVMWNDNTWFVSEDKDMAVCAAHRIKNLNPQDTVYLRTITTTQTDETIEVTQKSNNDNQQQQ